MQILLQEFRKTCLIPKATLGSQVKQHGQEEYVNTPPHW